jgi:hypothetical protein
LVPPAFLPPPPDPPSRWPVPSCGLWQLFHSLSVRLDAAEGRSFLAALRGFVASGFPCDDCRRHFLAAASQPAAAAVETRRDAGLWLWGMHNRVSSEKAAVVLVAALSFHTTPGCRQFRSVCRHGGRMRRRAHAPGVLPDCTQAKQAALMGGPARKPAQLK